MSPLLCLKKIQQTRPHHKSKSKASNRNNKRQDGRQETNSKNARDHAEIDGTTGSDTSRNQPAQDQLSNYTCQPTTATFQNKSPRLTSCQHQHRLARMGTIYSLNQYRLLAGLTDDSLLRMQLRTACSQDVNRLPFEYVGASTLDVATEALMAHIKA